MSMEAIRKITETEERVRRDKAEAVTQARQIREAAKERGEALLLQVRQEAALQEKEWMQHAEAQAQVQQEELAREIDAECAALRRRGESHLREAIDFIVERVVNS